MVLAAIEASPVESKPPAAVGERISKDGRHDLGAVVPLSTRTSSLQGRAGGSRRNWSRWSSGRNQPDWQNSYPHESLELP